MSHHPALCSRLHKVKHQRQTKTNVIQIKVKGYQEKNKTIEKNKRKNQLLVNE
jgi:hypothetical protein